MKLSLAFSALLALAPLDAVVGSKCCWPNAPPSPDELPPDALIAGLCDGFLDTGLIGGILGPILAGLAEHVNLRCLDEFKDGCPTDPIRRRLLPSGEEFSLEVTGIRREEKQKPIHDAKHRDLLTAEKILDLGVGIGYGAIMKKCYIPFPETMYDGGVIAFDEAACELAHPEGCDGGCACDDNYCITKNDVCRELMEGIVLDIAITVPSALGSITIGTSLNFLGVPCADPSMGDCCVLLDFVSDKPIHDMAVEFINAFLSASFDDAVDFLEMFGGSLPPEFEPLYLAIQGFFAEGFSTLEITDETFFTVEGTVDFRGDQLFAELCPFVLGEYCSDGRADGDPHIQAWNGQWFDFHGECDLEFLNAPDFGHGLGAEIQIRTTKRYEYSYISEAALRIGNDVVTIGSYGDYSFNGVNGAQLPSELANKYPVIYSHNKKSTKIVVEINHREQIVLSNFKDLVSVKLVNATSANYGSSTGLMGDFQHGGLKGRDGTIFEDMNAFGQEWQVRDTETSLFETARAPQYPQECVMPDATAKAERRRLGGAVISEEKAEEVCGHIADMDMRRNCIYDVVATNDADVAGTW